MNSIRTRVIALTLVMTACGIGFTAWLALVGTEQALRRQTEKSLEVDAAIYQSFINYGVDHRDWSGVQGLAEKLSAKHHRRIAITTPQGTVLADSDRADGGTPRPLPPAPTARLDPANPAVMGMVESSGPGDTTTTVLPTAAIQQALACLKINKLPFDAASAELGVITPDPDATLTGEQLSGFSRCLEIATPASPEVDQFLTRVMDCLRTAGLTPVRLGQEVRVVETTAQAKASRDACDAQAVAASIAPPANLYLGTRDGAARLVRSTWGTTAPLIAALLAAAALAAWVLGRRITTPIVRLAGSARALEAGDYTQPIPTHRTREVGDLSSALDSLAESLKRNEELRKQMVSDIAHELRNPLNTMAGTLEAIRDGVIKPSPAVLESLSEESMHLNGLVSDLQDLAVADAGGLHVTPVPADLADLVGAAVTAHRPSAELKGLELNFEATGSNLAMVDPVRFRQVLDNLLTNARRHTNAGSISVRVQDRDVVVADTGDGMSPDAIDNIFERFWRADASRSRATGGAGLGLPIAVELVRAHDARLTVESAIGRGSIFRITGLSAPSAATPQPAETTDQK